MWMYQGCERALFDSFMVKQIFSSSNVGSVKAVYLIGVLRGCYRTKSIKMEKSCYSSGVLFGSKDNLHLFFYHMILMPFCISE